MLIRPRDKDPLRRCWRSSFRAGFLLTAMWFAGSSGGYPQNLTNHPAPLFTRIDVQHNQVSLKNYRGKVVLLNFWGDLVCALPH